MKEHNWIHNQLNFKELSDFIKQVESNGIDIDIITNAPTIYLHKVNGQVVTERNLSEHLYVIGYIPVKSVDFKIVDKAKLSTLILKYCQPVNVN